MSDQFNPEYFENYGGHGSYEEGWENFTIPAAVYWQVLDYLEVKVESFVDLGAANGAWMNSLDLYINEEDLFQAEDTVEFQGVEINPEMAKCNVSRWSIEVGDANLWTPDREWSVIQFNGLAYLEEDSIQKLLDRCFRKCRMFGAAFVTWENRHMTFGSKPGDPLYEKTLKTVPDWFNFFSSLGWQTYYIHGFWFLKPTSSKEKRDPHPLFRVLDPERCLHIESGCLLEHKSTYGVPTLVCDLDGRHTEIPPAILELDWLRLELKGIPENSGLENRLAYDIYQKCYYLDRSFYLQTCKKV